MDYLNKSLPTIDSSAQKYLDQSFEKETSLPGLVLMEQAAGAVTELILSLILPGQNVLLIAGAGNNSGDAWATARQLLANEVQVTVLDLFPDKQLPKDAEINKHAYWTYDSPVITLDQLDLLKFDLIVDGILGTGFNLRRPLPDKIVGLLEKINSLENTLRVAIDIPTGVDSSTGACAQVVFNADYTVTFSALKTGMAAEPGCAYTGEIIIAPISMTSEWVDKKISSFNLPRVLTEDSISQLEIEQTKLSHKGSNGRTLLMGGSQGMSGAIILAMQAAHITGVGYTYIRVPQAIITDLLELSPESLIDEIPVDRKSISKLIDQVDSLAIGPGASRAEWLIRHLELICLQSNRLIIDADGLNVLSEFENWQQVLQQRESLGKQPAILTPHPGEFRRLAPDLVDILKEDRQEAALKLAKRSFTIVVLKGHATVIALPTGQVYLNSSGNQGLAKAGSGDVLTGLLAGFSAQTKNSAEAAVLSVYFHGLLADIAAMDLGIRGVTPSKLPGYASDAYQILGWIN